MPAASGSWNTSYGVDGGGNLPGDPGFVSITPNAEDLSIVCGDAAINSGDNAAIGSFAVLGDIDGNTRIYQGLIDIGAYENQGIPTASLPVLSLAGTVLSFGHSTSGPIDSLVWNFGDGSTSTADSGSHNYAVAGSYNVCLQIYSPCGQKDSCETIVVTGVADVPAAPSARIYPNPADNALFLEGIEERSIFHLYSASGAEVKAGILQPGENTLDISALSTGIYLLEIKNNTGAERHKLLKN